LGLSFGFKFWM